MYIRAVLGLFTLMERKGDSFASVPLIQSTPAYGEGHVITGDIEGMRVGGMRFNAVT